VPPTFVLTVVDEGRASDDELRTLRKWFIDVEDSSSRVELRHRPPEPGELGTALEALAMTLGPAVSRGCSPG
jgi:hypothetical protein